MAMFWESMIGNHFLIGEGFLKGIPFFERKIADKMVKCGSDDQLIGSYC